MEVGGGGAVITLTTEPLAKKRGARGDMVWNKFQPYNFDRADGSFWYLIDGY